MTPSSRCPLPSSRPLKTVLILVLAAGIASLSAADAPDLSAQRLSDAVAQCNLVQERLTSAVTANHPDAEIASLRQTLFDDQNLVLDLRYTPLLKTLLQATFANDLAGFQAVCTKQMSDYMTKPILASSAGYLTAQVPNQQYTLRYSGSYRKAAMTILFYVMRPAAAGDDLLFTLTVDDDKCAGLEMK